VGQQPQYARAGWRRTRRIGALVARRAAAGEIDAGAGGIEVERKLVVFADYACPFCYLGETQVARVRRGSGGTEGAAFELRPQGTPLPTLREPHLHDAWERVIEPLMQELQVEMRFPALATRTRKAHEAAAWARQEGAFAQLHEAIYRAYWQEGRDIGRIDVLMDIGAAVGLDRTGLKVALDIDQWTERVEQDREWAAQLGLSGVPAYLLHPRAGAEAGAGGELRVGMQRYDELRAWMTA
jgi:predicted DsbA family dithiol-disulfide isomerase